MVFVIDRFVTIVSTPGSSHLDMEVVSVLPKDMDDAGFPILFVVSAASSV